MDNIIHQFLVFALIYDRNDLIAFFHVVGSYSLIKGGAAVQVMNDKISELLLFLCDHTDSPFHILSEDKMIQNNAIEIGTQDT